LSDFSVSKKDTQEKSIPSDKLRWVTVPNPHGKKKGFYTYCFKAINRHWNVASLAYTFLMVSKLNSLSATNWIMQN